MNEMKKQHINGLTAQYLAKGEEAVLNEMYTDLIAEYRGTLNSWARKTIKSEYNDFLELFNDSLTSTLSYLKQKDGDFVKLFHLMLSRRYKSYLRKVIRRKKMDYYDIDDINEDGVPKYQLADDFNLEAEVTAYKKADQRQLIDFLVCGEDARTTAIVQAYLTTEHKTPTAIGNYLGLNHKQVTRALSRLAAKFNPKQFGSHQDYLVAL